MRRVEDLLAVALRLQKPGGSRQVPAPTADDDFADLVADMARAGMGAPGH